MDISRYYSLPVEGAFNFEYWPFSEKLEKWPRRGKRKEREGRVEMGEREGHTLLL